MRRRNPKGMKQQLEQEIAAAALAKAREICKVADVVVSLRSVGGNFRGTIEVRKAPDYAESQFLEHAPTYGLSTDLLGATIILSDGSTGQYKIVGWNQSAKKFKVIARHVTDGTLHPMSPELIKSFAKRVEDG